MQNEIVNLISRYISLNEEETGAIAECIPIKSFSKGTILLKAGEISTDSYFVIKGCVRSYFIINDEERTTAFYIEEDAVASLTSYTKQTPAKHFLSCVEDSTLAVLNYEKEKELYERVPKFESLCRISMEQDFGKQQQELADFITSSPEERYLNLLETRPELLNRVPQYHLASYLGVKPESLSRIRKRVALKK